MPDYERVYREQPDYFSAAPTALITDHADSIAAGGRVLDIGVGQGRNALALARRGFNVVGIDLSPTSIEVTGLTAKREGVALELWQGSFLDYPAAPASFAAILVFGVVQELPRHNAETLFERIIHWMGPGGLLFLTAWHTGDPTCEELRQSAEPLGKNSFDAASGESRTFMEPDEVLTLLPGWDAVHHWEGMGPMHRHGDDDEPHQHGGIELVARKPD